MSYPTNHGLAVHQGMWCKKRKNAKKPSQKGTVADRIEQKKKKEEQQKGYPKVNLGMKKSRIFLSMSTLEQMYQMIVTQNNRSHIRRRFCQYKRHSWPVACVRLHHTLNISTMSHSCEAMQFTKRAQPKVNGVNSL